VDALPPLESNPAAAGQPEGEDGLVDLDTRARLLERVAREISRLSFQMNRGKVGRFGAVRMFFGRW